VITKVKIPKVSANVEEETITAWLKREGDPVRKGDPIVEITTDKASFELESPRRGVLRRILAKEKSVLPVGYVIALVGQQSDPLPDVTDTNRALLEARRRTVGRRRRRPGKHRLTKRVSVRATPAARRLARELGIDLTRLKEEAKADVVTEDIVRRHSDARKQNVRSRSRPRRNDREP